MRKFQAIWYSAPDPVVWLNNKGVVWNAGSWRVYHNF